MAKSNSVMRTVVGVGFAAIALLFVVSALGFDLLSSPFGTSEVDRSTPVLLTEIREISDLHVAEGNFEIVVDIEDDVKFLPDAIAGQRVQYVAVGSVDAVVDFTSLDESSIVANADEGSVAFVLPSPVLADPVINTELSHVMNRDRGVLDRLGGLFVDNPTGERELVLAAEDKMAAAAQASDLRARAETQTVTIIENLVGALGYDDVTVTFLEPAPPVTAADAG